MQAGPRVTEQETRITAFTLHGPSEISSSSEPGPRPCFSRITRHGFFCRGCATGGATGNPHPDHCPRRQVTGFQFTIVHYCSPLFSKKYCLRQCPRAARSLLAFPPFPGISRQKMLPLSQCQLTVRCSRWASRQAPFAADPVALRARSAATIPTFPQPRRRRFSLLPQGDISIEP